MKIKRIKGRQKFSSKPKSGGHPFVVCIKCGKEKGFKSMVGKSDLEVAKRLWKLNWSIEPTYCPVHSKK